MESWVRGCVAENDSLFCPSGFAIGPYFFEKSGFLISNAFFFFAFSLKIGCKNWLNLY